MQKYTVWTESNCSSNTVKPCVTRTHELLTLAGYPFESRQAEDVRRRLEAKIMVTRREISLLTALSRGVNLRTELAKKYNTVHNCGTRDC